MMNQSSDAITTWLSGFKRGEQDPVAQLFDHYFHRLVALASQRLTSRPELTGYDEDVALSAFKSLCMGAERGRFPRLENRHELWQLLAVITVRKAIDLQRRKQYRGQSELTLEDYLHREPPPDEVAEMSERVRYLLEILDDPDLRTIALLKVEGFSNGEIARRMDCVERTIERKLQRIRLKWQEELPT